MAEILTAEILQTACIYIGLAMAVVFVALLMWEE